MDGSGFFRTNTDPHPTPQHIRGCIFDAITAHNKTAAANGHLEIPVIAWKAVCDGISEAIRQHDKGL